MNPNDSAVEPVMGELEYYRFTAAVGVLQTLASRSDLSAVEAAGMAVMYADCLLERLGMPLPEVSP